MFLVEQIQRPTHTELMVFSRNEKGEKETKVVNDFKPYFYVDETETIPDDNRIFKVEHGHKFILGTPLKKIILNKSSDVAEMREMFDKHYESDILFNMRYITDVIGQISPYKLKTLFFDIETNTDGDYPNVASPTHEITAISMSDNFENKDTMLILKCDTWKEGMENSLKNKGVIICNTEEELLATFIHKVVKYDPDIISGWYINGFDLQYLFNRAKQLGIDLAQISPLNFIKIDKKYGDMTIKGRLVLDMLKCYMYFRKISNQGKAEGYSLENVGRDVLGEGKIPHTETFRELWMNNPIKLMEYNLKDVLLVKRIDEKLKIIDFFNQIRCKACVPFDKIFLTTIFVDSYLLNRFHNLIVFPSKQKNELEEFEGAAVILPIPGVYRKALAMDVKGMYPNIIKTFDVSYETFNPDGEIKICEGIGFNSGKGIIPLCMEELEKERFQIKKMMKAAKTEDERQLYNFQQYAIKVIMNSFFGYIGCPSSRLYKKEIAGAITTIGRKIIRWTADLLKKQNYNILYGDTDSIFFTSKNDCLIDILKEGKKLMAEINSSYKELAKMHGSDNCTIEIEFEKIFDSIIFTPKKGEDRGAKKRYAYKLLWEENNKVTDKVHFKGLDVKRSDCPKIGREAQETVVTMILNGESQDTVISYLKTLDTKIRTRRISDEDIGFPKEIKEPLSNYGRIVTDEDGRTRKTGVPPIVAGARYSNKYLGTRFKQGDKPKWVYVKGVPNGFPTTNVIAFDTEVPKNFTIDYDEMNKKIFESKLSQLFISAGFGKFPNINNNIKQLNQWFKNNGGAKNESN